MRQSLIYRKAKKTLDRTLQLLLLFIAATSVIGNLPIATGQSSNSYAYEFTVNEEGFTRVDITFQSTTSPGSSWIIVPKFSPWKYDVTPPGQITGSNVVNETQNYIGDDYYFYQVFEFSFSSTSSFQMKIQFNMTEGALIIEPRGVFFSPLVGFDPASIGRSKAEILFPSNFKVKEDLIASSSEISTHTVPDSNRVLFNLQNNLERLQVEFETAAAEPSLKLLNQSVFTFQTVKRYENYASEILTLFDAVYDDFTDLFNVTLEDIDVQFFIPEFETLLAVGGFVPFVGRTLGEININIFFVRAVNGTIETIALHELVHHFLWKTGLSPDIFLWVHEGAGQYVSIETVDDLGYEGAALERDRLEQSASQLISQTGEDFGFLQDWTPENQGDVGRNYVASYYVTSRLAEKYGGLDFYKQFFELIQGLDIKTNDMLAFYMSLAANATVDLTLKQWGFNIRLLYTESKISPELIHATEKAIDGVNPVFQPYKFIAETLFQQALLRLENGDVEGANQLLNTATSLANLAPLLTLLTLAALLAITVYILHKHTSKPTIEPPPLPPTFEEPTT